MKNSKMIALLNFSGGSDDRIRTLGQNVFKSMSGNAYFAQPTVDMKTLGANLDNYVNSIPTKEVLSSDLAAIKNQYKTILKANLTALCNYVNGIANGNRVILVTSGFDITPETKAKPEDNSVPTNVNVKIGSHKGSMVMSCDAQKSAKTYEARAKNGTDIWSEPISSTKSKTVTLKGLIPGHVYEFQMRTFGTSGSSEWSDTISTMVI
jgi:hypothetical protein